METSLGKHVAALRREKGWTQEQLAERMEVSPQAVSKWENDQSCPDIALLPKLAETLGVTVDNLLSPEKEPPVRLLPEKERKDIQDMLLRILVDSADGDRVRINLPLALVQTALDMEMELPNVSGVDKLKNIDLKQVLELVRRGMVGNLVEVDSADGDSVRIFVE